MKFKERITSELSPAQFPRRSLTVRSASPRKGTNESAPHIPKRSPPLHKGINGGAPRIPKRQERALGRWRGSGTHRGQDSTGHDIGSRTSKSSSSSKEPARGHQNPPPHPRSRTARFWKAIVGPKNLATWTHFISSPRLTPSRKKCPRTNEKGPNCQEMLPRTILSSVNRDHGRKKRHAAKGSPPERPKGKHKCNESALGVWWRSNSMRNCHLRIKCPQLTSWPHLCGQGPWTVLSRSP